MFIENLLHGLVGLTHDAATFFGLSAQAYCDIETTDDEYTIVCHDGSLLSVLRLDGISRMLATAEMMELAEKLATQFRSYLCQPGHDLQVVFSRETERRAVRRAIDDAMAPSVATVRRLNMDLEDILQARGDSLEAYCAIERSYIVLWTNPKALTPMERRESGKDTIKARRELPRAVESQQLGIAIARLRETHASLRESLLDDLNKLEFLVEPLTACEALTLMRTEVDSEWTDNAWTPAVPSARKGGLMRAAWSGLHPKDVSSLMWPPLAEQLIPRGVEPVGFRAVRIGGRLFMPMVLSLPPAQVQPFDVLFQRLRDARTPYRVSFRLTGAGVEDTEIRVRSLMSYLSTSRTVRNALGEAMEDHRNGVVRMGFQMSACTWVTGSMDDLMQAGARLARAIQGWGSCEVDDRLGNPVTPLLMTVPGLRRHSLGPLSVPPIEDAVAMLPVGRPAMPWKTGSFLLRSYDGKLQPYQPYSSLQKAWVTLAYAPMGSGKSVALNALNLALCTNAGLERLPRIGITDIGPSSFGLISLIRDALPPASKHLATYHRLRMVPDDSINPADTPLGMRAPLPLHRSFLINLLTLLTTPVGETAAPTEVPHLASTVVDMAFHRFADDGESVRRYSRNVDTNVDAVLASTGIHHDEKTTWWELVDALFDAGEFHAATLAQRHAMPLLSEMAALARDPLVAQQFRGFAPNGEPVTEYFYRSITQSVREYPILARATRLDLGEARLVSLDLADVAPTGSANADRQTDVMYLLARHVLGKDFFVHTDDVKIATMPVKYREHHLQRAQRSAEDVKRLCYDEFHRAKSPLIRAQVVLDIREGRKANLETVIASQLLQDFSQEIVALATTIFILGVGQTSLKETVETFQLSPHAAKALERLGKPGSAGARLVGIFTAGERNIRYVHELMLTLSPVERWAFSTTAEDRVVRDRLYRMVGPARARQLLAARYPSGTAKDEVERRRASMSERGLSGEKAEATLIDDLVAEVMRDADAHATPS